MLAAEEIRAGEDVQRFLHQEMGKELLRFTTAGSVDDGKSTLIGRLLHDCKAVYEDQLASVKKSRINRSGKAVDFSLLTDGLRAEREQGITIDVAYRYFSTARRKFIIADTPGHEQYTRNMATGASTADLAVILIDASKGVLQQTRRHAYISSLLGISHVLTAVNKMDLVDYSEAEFVRLRDEFFALATGLGISTVQCIPVSALEGDNIVERGQNMTWYSGPTLLEHLEAVPIAPAVQMKALRFPVQLVIRPDASFRGFAGRVASGSIRAGQEILALPSEQKARVESIVTFDGELEEAHTSQSITLKLDREIDLSRGDLIVSADTLPHVSSRFNAMVVWMHATPFEPNRQYLAKHIGRYVKAKGAELRFRLDVNTFAEHPAQKLAMNEIGSVDFETSQPLYFDAYESNRTMGSFILIDPLTNATVGAAMMREPLQIDWQDQSNSATTNVRAAAVSFEERIQRRGHRPAIFTIKGERRLAEALERALVDRGFEAVLVRYEETPAPGREMLFSTFWRLGFVVLAWGENGLPAPDRALLNQIAGRSCFDLSGDSLGANGLSGLENTLQLAETLRNKLPTDAEN